MTPLETLLGHYPTLKPCETDILEAYRLLEDTFERGGKLLLCGNGGSAADCEHIVGELVKGFHLKRPLSSEERAAFTPYQDGEKIAACLQGGLPAISFINFTSLNTAFANDAAPEYTFAQSAYALGRHGDCMLGISTSGNAKNVIAALIAAKARGAKTLGLTGRNGGAMRDLCDVCIVVPAQETYRIQEYHLPIYHALCAMLEEHFWKV